MIIHTQHSAARAETTVIRLTFMSSLSRSCNSRKSRAVERLAPMSPFCPTVARPICTSHEFNCSETSSVINTDPPSRACNDQHAWRHVTFIAFCRMTNYELLRWLVETPSRDVDHYHIWSTRHGRRCVVIMINGQVTVYHYNDTRSRDAH